MNKYNRIVSPNYYCFVVLLEMIINYEGWELDCKKTFSKYITLPKLEKNVKQKENEAEFGIHINKDIINMVFEKNCIPLIAEYYPVDETEDYEFNRIIENALNKNQHIIITISYGKLYGNIDKLNIGHALIVSKKEKERIWVYDPGPKKHGEKYIKIDDVYLATKYRNGGIYTFKKKGI